MSAVPIVLLFAVAENGVIGNAGTMPWRLSSDLKRFKADTMGKPVIMGRKTWDSIGKPLPGRANIVVTRSADFHADGARVASTVDEALVLADEAAAEMGAPEICVMGGGEIYRQTLDRASKLSITRILAEIEGDTVFSPVLDPDIWNLDEAIDYPAGEKDSHPTRHEIWVRR